MGALKNEDGFFGYPQHKYDWEIRFFCYTLLTKDLLTRKKREEHIYF